MTVHFTRSIVTLLFTAVLTPFGLAAPPPANLEEATPGPADVAPSSGADRGRALYQACVTCHGQDGAGNKSLGAPRLAGQESWYIEAQILKIKGGARSLPEDNKAFSEMVAQVRHLASEDDIALLAEYIAQLKAPPAPATFTASSDLGKNYFNICISCHGERGEGNRTIAAPRLAGLQDWYIAAQLERFRAGQRGTNPADGTGAVMMPVALAVPDEQAAKAVAGYIASTLSP